MDTERNEIIVFPYRKKEITLLAVGVAAYVGLKELCEVTGLNVNSSFARVKKQQDLLSIRKIAIADQHFVGLPIFNLSWFLLTARSKDPYVNHDLVFYSKELPSALEYFWYRHLGTNIKPCQFMKEYMPHIYGEIPKPSVITEYKTITKTKRIYIKPVEALEENNNTIQMEPHDRIQKTKPWQRKKPNRVTNALVAEMITLRKHNMSMTKIGQFLGVSATTVCQCLNGKYPIPLD